MRMRDVRAICMFGFFWAVSTTVGENALAANEAGTVSAGMVVVREQQKAVIQATSSDSGIVPLRQRKANELLFLRKKKAAQTPELMLDEKNLGLGCSKP